MNDTTITVLLVDDDAVARSGIARALTARGMDVRSAANGLDALKAARTNRFDLVLLDLRLRDQTGAEVVRALRVDARAASTRVFLLAMNGDSDAVEAAMKAGADSVLRKDQMQPLDIALEVSLMLRAKEQRTTREPSAAEVAAALSQTQTLSRETIAPIWADGKGPPPRDAVEAFQTGELIETRDGRELAAVARRRFAPRRAPQMDSIPTLVPDTKPPVPMETAPRDSVSPRGRAPDAELFETGEIHLKAPPPRAPGRGFGNPEHDVYAGVVNPLIGGVGRLAEAMGLPANLMCPACKVHILLHMRIDDLAARSVKAHFSCPQCGSK